MKNIFFLASIFITSPVAATPVGILKSIAPDTTFIGTSYKAPIPLYDALTLPAIPCTSPTADTKLPVVALAVPYPYVS